MEYSIVPLSHRAALVSFGNLIDVDINRRVTDLHRRLCAEPFAGFVESVPAYSSLAAFYDPLKIIEHKESFSTAFERVKNHLERILAKPFSSVVSQTNVIEIPVLYDGEDIEFVAREHGLSIDDVIAIHSGKTYRVYLLGFLPGFAYMGAVDDRVATPRKSTPRTHVPAGTVGIAGAQTGIYPLQSPGGWQLIGRTPVKIFDKRKSAPCLFAPGDEVRFFSIDQKEFNRRNEY